MESDKNGIAFSKGELKLLRQYGSKDITNREFFGVHVHVKGESVCAWASNGRTMAVEINGIADGKFHDLECFVSMKFLIDGRKQLEGKELLRLGFSGASLHEASIEQAGIIRETLTSQNDMAIPDVTLPGICKQLKKPAARREKVHCMAIAPDYLKAAALAAEAAEEGQLVEIFPPSSPDGWVVFQVDGDKNTSIIGQVLANATVESVSEDGDDEEDEDEKPKARRGKKNGRQPNLSIVEEPETTAN